jgi:hypothetical protein
MKSTLRFGFAMVLAMFAFLGSSQTAQAAVYSHHSGTICKNWDYYNSARIDYVDYGTRINGAGSVSVICPLVRATTNSAGATADVDVYASGTQTISCTLSSYSYNSSTPIGSVTQTWTGTGYHEFGLYLGSGKSNFWSTYSVRCSLPGNYAGILQDIDLIEY